MIQNVKKEAAAPFVLVGLGGIFLYLNRITPLVADDYFYACRLDYAQDGTLLPVSRLQGLWDILLSQKCVYMAHSGRIPVLSSVQLFTLAPELLFDCCNVLVFLLLLLMMTRLARPDSAGKKAATPLCAGLLIWHCTPAFGQDLLWHTGAINYLWTMTATLTFLLQCLQPHPRLGVPGAFGLGLVSGWSMENQSAAACCLCLFCLFRRLRREHRVPKTLAAGTAGQLLGFALLMLAPGNYRRSAGYGQTGLFSAEMLSRTVQYTKALWNEFAVLIVLTSALLLLVLLTAPGRAARPLWLAGGAVLCHLSMAASPAYPLRSMFGFEIFTLAAFLACLNALNRRKLLLPLLCVLLGVSAAADFPEAAADLSRLYTVTEGRARYILEQRARGIRDITVPVASADTRFNPLWGDALSDLMQDPANERNRALALYYDADIIRGDPEL